MLIPALQVVPNNGICVLMLREKKKGEKCSVVFFANIALAYHASFSH